MDTVAMNTGGRAPWHLWAVGGLGLCWNAIGIVSFVATQAEQLAAFGFNAEQLSYFYGFPLWAVAVWAMGVWGAFIGSILLLLRSRWAVLSYAISVVGLVGTTVFERVFADMPLSMQTGGQDALALFIWAVTLLQTGYAFAMRRRGVLR